MSESSISSHSSSEKVELSIHIDSELLDQIKHLTNDPSKVIETAIKQWLRGERREEDQAMSLRRTPPVPPRGEWNDWVHQLTLRLRERATQLTATSSVDMRGLEQWIILFDYPRLGGGFRPNFQAWTRRKRRPQICWLWNFDDPADFAEKATGYGRANCANSQPHNYWRWRIKCASQSGTLVVRSLIFRLIFKLELGSVQTTNS